MLIKIVLNKVYLEKKIKNFWTCLVFGELKDEKFIVSEFYCSLCNNYKNKKYMFLIWCCILFLIILTAIRIVVIVNLNIFLCGWRFSTQCHVLQ